ncbi:MAG: tetratricopeptide repeat protein [Treponema sp.]|jgi:tetratricopeptide (TPR) repeat protein|nr:tetratricopeptide repeat protein [Treponema sp.]
MKRNTIAAMLLVIAASIHAADKYAPLGGSSLANELQWLSIQTACTGQYNMAQTGDYSIGDPQDYYTPADIREYLTELSGGRTATTTFYGICFDYALAAYNDILTYRDYYEGKGMRRGGWYIAATANNSRQIILYDPSSRKESTVIMNGMPLKEVSRQNVQAHGDAVMHAWLWVYGNDGAIYWIDPTWTDNTGYAWWGVVENGREVQRNSARQLSAVTLSSNSEALALFNSGNANMKQKRYDQAITDFTAALRINPNDAAAYNGRGNAYGEKEMYDRAIEDWTAALRIDPNYALAYYNRGVAYYLKGMYDRAIEDGTAALRINPNYTDAYYGRGNAYYLKGMDDRAIEDWTAALRINPNDAEVYYNRGHAYYGKRMYDRAIEDWTATLRIDPNYAGAYYNRGSAYYRKGMYDRAIEDWTAALRINPNDALARGSIEMAREKRGY